MKAYSVQLRLNGRRHIVSAKESPNKWAGTMDTLGIKELLYRNNEHPWWNNVPASCCGKSTMVCPTYLCTIVEDVADEKGEHAERWRTWTCASR
jgi:hypothetical protein